MKINNINMFNVNPYKKQADKVDALQKTTAKKDDIQISSEAMDLLKSERIDQQRLDKVNALKEQIQNGEYQVDADAVAKKMLDFWSTK